MTDQLNHPTIRAEDFREFAIEVWQRAGLPADQAEHSAAPLVWASLRGVDTHGVRIFKSYYVDTLVSGQLERRPDFRIEYDSPIAARADGGRGLGLAAASWGMRLAIEKAHSAGIGLVSMRNSNHLGALGYYAEMAVEHDMIGVCMSGHLYAEGNYRGMAPALSLQPMFGTNPLSVAIPCGQQPDFMLDMATAIVPVNRVEFMCEKGQAIPLGWCLDSTGQPTSDPAMAKVYLPLGSTRELGSHKGFGLAMLVQVMTAVLSGGWAENAAGCFTQEKIAHFFGAMRIDLFGQSEQFKKGMDETIAALHRAPAAPGYDKVYVPGEIEHDTKSQRSVDGIPLTEKELGELRDLSSRYSVPLRLSG